MEKSLFLDSHKSKQLVIRLDFMHVSLLIDSCEIIVSSLSYFFVSSSIWQRFQNSLKASFIIQLYLSIVLFYSPETFFIENIKYYYYFLNKCLVWFVVPTYICKTVASMIKAFYFVKDKFLHLMSIIIFALLLFWLVWF